MTVTIATFHAPAGYSITVAGTTKEVALAALKRALDPAEQEDWKRNGALVSLTVSTLHEH